MAGEGEVKSQKSQRLWSGRTVLVHWAELLAWRPILCEHNVEESYCSQINSMMDIGWRDTLETHSALLVETRDYPDSRVIKPIVYLEQG